MGMQIGRADWTAAVAFARKELTELLEQLAHIEKTFPAEQYAYLMHLLRLKNLHSEEPVLQPDAQEELWRYKLSRAMRRGLASPDSVPKVSPYEAEVEKLIEAAARKPAAYEALSDHAAKLISDNHVMIPQLRIFVTEVLRRERKRPPARGTPKVHPSRNPLLYSLLLDIVARFRVTPTRNKAATAGTSACDIVAEAMPNDPRLPKSYIALERIWINGPRDEREFDALLSMLAKDP
jgi:hypothetical protein